MKRRTFLQTTGLAIAGGGAVAAGPRCSSQAHGMAPEPAATSVLITSAQTRLGRALAAELGKQRRVVLMNGEDIPTDENQRKANLLNNESVTGLVHGIGAIVHIAEAPGGTAPGPEIDYRTRGTYNLLQAAVEGGVAHAVYLSSLQVMRGYDDRFAVTEDWRPEPTTAPEAMSHYLGEFTCREFARDGRIRIGVLRLGNLVRPEEVEDKPFDPLWLAESDAAQAVRLTLNYLEKQPPPDPWAVFHIASGACPRFPITKAKRVLGYRPEFNG